MKKERCIGTNKPKCQKPVVWIRHTQFAGSHPFCQQHAEQEEDFGEDGDSYFFWEKVDA